ncbi:MAG: hypothetical protein QFX34_02975 [Candidatus Verstraetearchaeota archaeon]|nr:hypothetical protein [Candidatus Verstraetearchaeota archaeon]
MHEAITKILILSTMILSISLILFAGYHLSTGVGEGAEGILQTKAQEIGFALSRNESSIVNGLSTGRLLIKNAELEPFNLTMVLPGGSQTVLLNKTALCIVGEAIHEPPRENFSFTLLNPQGAVEANDGRGFVRFLNAESDQGRVTYMIPLLGIIYSCSGGDQNVTVHSVKVLLNRIDGFVSSSGRFDLLILKTNCEAMRYARYTSVPSHAEIYVDNQLVVEFSVSAGAKVTIDLVCSHSFPIVLR